MPARIEEYLKKLIKRKFNVSYMSNTKWRKVFTALEPIKIQQAYWKFVDLDQEIRSAFITSHDLMEKYIGDYGVAVAPFAYRRIEWVEIPKTGINPQYEKIPFMNFTQDIETVENILTSLGKFEFEHTERGLRIYGHRQ